MVNRGKYSFYHGTSRNIFGMTITKYLSLEYAAQVFKMNNHTYMVNCYLEKSSFYIVKQHLL